MKYATCDITQLADAVEDSKDYPTRNGARRADSPSFIFRDEREHEDSDTLWGRELALDFEEWKARKEQREQYLSGQLMPAFIPKDGALDFILATMSEIEEWMDKPTSDKKPVMVARDKDGVLQEWSPTVEPETLAYFERQNNREICNWHTRFQKRRPKNNDHWRKAIAPLASKLDDPVKGGLIKALFQALKESLPYGPGPIRGTVFRNPNGSRYETAGTNIGAAKNKFIERHNIKDEFVSAERVQYENERHSKIVVGLRRSSAETASSYYDPNPIKDDHGYIPRACNLLRVPASKVLPDENCQVLTVRELERAIIAGAELCEDEMEAFASTLEDAETAQFDTREGGLSFDDSCDFRTMLDLTEQENWLYWKLWGAGLEEAAQAMLTARPGDIQRYIPGIDGALLKLGTDQPLTDDEEVAAIMLGEAKEEDLEEQANTGRLQWSRFDFLRNLHEGETAQESIRFRELINDAFELNLDVLNNTESRPAYLSW